MEINDILTYNITNSHHFVCHNGFIFVELSDKLLEYFKTQNISVYGEIDAFRNEKINKYVALVHINFEHLQSRIGNNKFNRSAIYNLLLYNLYSINYKIK